MACTYHVIWTNENISNLDVEGGEP